MAGYKQPKLSGEQYQTWPQPDEGGSPLAGEQYQNPAPPQMRERLPNEELSRPSLGDIPKPPRRRVFDPD